MVTKEDKFRGYLRSKGLKFTTERRFIIEEVFSLHNHFDVEELFGRLLKKDKPISRATIYRTLPLLIESGLVREALRSQDRVRYEHIFGHEHHDHLLCLGCGKLIEFKEEDIEMLQDVICKRYRFRPVEHRLGIRGYCKACKSHD